LKLSEVKENKFLASGIGGEKREKGGEAGKKRLVKTIKPALSFKNQRQSPNKERRKEKRQRGREGETPETKH